MPPDNRQNRFEEVKRCLTEADRAFARAGTTSDDRERLALIEEAETWLVRAERRLARLTDRQSALGRPERAPTEARSFEGAGDEPRGPLWRRRPHA